MKNNRSLKQTDNERDFILYTTPSGDVKVEVFLHNENIWLTQAKIAELFNIDRSVVAKHIKNIFESEELKENFRIIGVARDIVTIEIVDPTEFDGQFNIGIAPAKQNVRFDI